MLCLIFIMVFTSCMWCSPIVTWYLKRFTNLHCLLEFLLNKTKNFVDSWSHCPESNWYNFTTFKTDFCALKTSNWFFVGRYFYYRRYGNPCHAKSIILNVWHTISWVASVKMSHHYPRHEWHARAGLFKNGHIISTHEMNLSLFLTVTLLFSYIFYDI